MGQRLDQLHAFIWWTAPLYAVFAGVGLVETHFTVTLALAALLAVLAAFGLFDGLILASVRGIRTARIESVEDLATVRSRLDRLARATLVGGGALAAAALVALAALWIAAP